MNNKLIKLHVGLFRYLKIELKQKKFKEVIKLLLKIAPLYFQELLKLYKFLLLQFDSDYCKQRKEYEKNQQIKIDLQRALKMLQYIDKQMAKAGKTRQERRGFWRDFYKNAQTRNEVFGNLAKEIK